MGLFLLTASCTIVFLLPCFYAALRSIIVIAENEKAEPIDPAFQKEKI
jgi:hypothetical protein